MPFPRILALVLAGATVAGCASSPRNILPEGSAPSGPAPFTVAVLPFELVTKPQDPNAKEEQRAGREREGAHVWTEEERRQLRPELRLLREIFANRFSTLPYKDIPLDRVDDLLAKAGAADSTAAQAMSPKALGKALGVDAVIVVKLWRFSSESFGIGYSRSIGGRIEMIDTRTAQTLWGVEHTEVSRGGLLFESGQVISAIENQRRNASNQAFLMLSEEFSRSVLMSCPSLAEVPKSELVPPPLHTVIPPSHPAPYRAGETVIVSAEGAPGMNAAFSIGRWKMSIPMAESTAGIYTGAYIVSPGDTVAASPLTVTLTSGYGVSQSLTQGEVAIDAARPLLGATARITARDGKVDIDWMTHSEAGCTSFLIYRTRPDGNGLGVLKIEQPEQAGAAHESLEMRHVSFAPNQLEANGLTGIKPGETVTVVPYGANGVAGVPIPVIVK